MRYALMAIMLIACGDKEEDTASEEAEELVEESSEGEAGDTGEESSEEEGE